MAGCEGYGCEPVFALAYIRHVNDNGQDLQLAYTSPQFAQALAEAGIPSDRLVAVSFADNRPRAGNETPEGRSKNRRIEIRLALQKMSDLDELRELCEFIREASLCGLGQTAPNPVLSTLQYFRHEYEDHILHQHCEAGEQQRVGIEGRAADRHAWQRERVAGQPQHNQQQSRKRKQPTRTEQQEEPQRAPAIAEGLQVRGVGAAQVEPVRLVRHLDDRRRRVPAGLPRP